MGSVAKKYNFLNYRINGIPMSMGDVIKFAPINKACILAMDNMHYACANIKKAVTEKRQIDSESIIKGMYSLLKRRQTDDMKWDLPDNLPGGFKYLYLPSIEGGDVHNSDCKLAYKNGLNEFDVVHIAVGINYKGYYSNFVRTLLINPTERISHYYNFLALIKRIIVYTLRDGIELSKVCRFAISQADCVNMDLGKYLKKEFGFALGPDCDKDLVINLSSKGIAKHGMTFSMNVNLIGLEEEGRTYDLRSSDTLIVRTNKPAELVTYFHRYKFDAVIKTRS